MRKRSKKKKETFIDTDTVIDLDAQREARRRQLREAAAESRRKRGVSDIEASGYDYYGYSPDAQQDVSAEAGEYAGAVSRESRKRKGLTPIRMGIIAVALIAAVCLVCSIWNIVSLKIEEKESRERIEALKQEKKELKAEVANIGTEEYIEEQARQWLKMAKSGEIIYVFDHSGDEKDSDK